MKLIELGNIIVGDRQRSKIEKEQLNHLIDSILSPKGLLHPIVVKPNRDGTYSLVAGERRFRAIESIFEEDLLFTHAGTPVPLGMIPASVIGSDLTEVDIFEAELEENLIRVPLSWQDETKATAALRSLKLEQKPEATNVSIAKEIKETVGESGPSEHTIRRKLTVASVVAEHLDDPDVAKARNSEEAYNLVMRKEAAKVKAALIEKRKAKLTSSPASAKYSVLKGSCLDILPTLPAESYDLILTDPPYGINVDKTLRQRTKEHHNYEDTPELAESILKAILREGFRLLRPKGNIFIFHSIDFFPLFKTFASQQGFTPWSYPIIWQKSEHEGLAPWQRQGFIRTYDCIFFCTKGQKGLQRPHLDILPFKRVSRAERIHGAEKPLDLLSLLIDLSTIPGDFVLDPCCGSGSTLAAAKRLGRSATGIEVSEDYANLALSRVDETSTIEVPEDTSTQDSLNSIPDFGD